MKPRSVTGHCPQSSMMSASSGRGPVIAGCVAVACGTGVGVAAGGLGCGVSGIALGAGAVVGSAVAGAAVAADGTGAGVVCVEGGVRVQAKPMTANDTVRMTHGTIAERGARRRDFFFGDTTLGLRASASASLFG